MTRDEIRKKWQNGEFVGKQSENNISEGTQLRPTNQRFQEEIDLLNERYGGIKDMTEQPAAVIVIDAIEDKNAIKEAKVLGIPVFAITDTNVDPSNIDYVIPANDDAIKTTKLILDYFVEAIKEGKK